MERRFHLFVQRHEGVGYSVSVLTHPQLASFGADVGDGRADLAAVLARLLHADRLGLRDEETWWPDLRLLRVELQVRAIQHGRLLPVPMRFTVLTHAERAKAEGARDDAGYVVRVPRLGLATRLRDLADTEAWVEEAVRDALYLAPLERLLAASYDGEETVETLVVDYKPHAPAAPRDARPPRAPVPDALAEAARLLNADTAALDRAFQRDGDVNALLHALAAGGRASALLVGPSGVGKTAIVHEMVHRIEAAGEGSPWRGLEVHTTSGGRIIAGMFYLGQWQRRVQGMLEALRTRRAVLHVESLAELLGTGRASEGLDLASFLAPAVEAGDVTLLAEATPEDLARAERSHPGLLRGLRVVSLAPLPHASALLALRSVATRLGKARKVRIADDAVARAAELAERFGEASLPGGAVQLLRAAVHAPGADLPADGARRDRVVTEADVTRAFTQRTGYPREIVDPSVAVDPAEVLHRLTARVVGQDGAMALLRDLVVMLKTGLTDPSRPLGSFLLLGPTGVGKTESALSLAHYLFGDEQRMARFDMSEYAAPGSAARLVSDHGGEGSLARRVREQPFGIVLLDEVEKADAGVHDLLLQVLGEGRLTDATGRTVSFRNTIVMLTSNLGADSVGRSLGFGDGAARDAVAHYVAAAAAFFRPELLNRVDHVVPYAPLAPATVARIARRALAAALEREGVARRGVAVRYDDAVVARVAALGFDPRYGARPLKRAIERWVVAPLAQLLAARATPPREVALRVDGDAITVVAAPDG